MKLIDKFLNKMIERSKLTANKWDDLIFNSLYFIFTILFKKKK